MTQVYAGIGSRKTPAEIITVIKKIAILLALDGKTLSTGAALGADQAFAEGANMAHGKINLHLPWATYEQAWRNTLGNITTSVLGKNDSSAFKSVEDYHPAAAKLTQGPKALHARNFNIITKPLVDFIVCWTTNGTMTGGTGQALRIADALQIKIYNLGDPATLEAMLGALERRSSEVAGYTV